MALVDLDVALLISEITGSMHHLSQVARKIRVCICNSTMNAECLGNRGITNYIELSMHRDSECLDSN